MRNLKRCGLVFLGVIGCLFPSFAQEERAAELERIVVSKDKGLFARAYSLGPGDLENLPFDSPAEALCVLPIDLQSRSPRAGIQTDFSLRGSNFQDVLILLDGKRINDPQTAHFNADLPFTSADIAGLRVMPSAPSSLFGPDAIGGAVDFIIRKPGEKIRVLKLSGGEYGFASQLFSIGDRFRELGFRFSVEHEQSSGFREDTDFKKFTASASAVSGLPLGEFNFKMGYQQKAFGAFDFYTPGLGYPSKEWTRTYLVDAGCDLEKDGLRIQPNFIWRRHFDKFVLDKSLIRSSFIANHRNDTYTPGIYFQKDLSKLGRLGLGLEYGQERITSTTLGRHNRDHKSVYLDDSIALAAGFSADLSLRLDDFDGFDHVYTGSLALRYEVIPRHFLHFSFSRNMRVPSFTELYYNDPATIGNAGLLPEKSLNYEAGYELRKEGFSCGSAIFLRQEDDFIDWVKNDALSKWQARNIPGADVLGIEARCAWEMNKAAGIKSNYTYINKFTDTSGYSFKYGPNYARHLWNGEFFFRFPRGTQSVGFTYKHKPGRSGWFLLNARVNYDLSQRASLFISGTNLLNAGYEEIEGIPQPGRWVSGGIKIEW